MTRLDDAAPSPEGAPDDLSSVTGSPESGHATTGGGSSVGRVAGQDVGYAGETGAERREAAAEAAEAAGES